MCMHTQQSTCMYNVVNHPSTPHCTHPSLGLPQTLYNPIPFDPYGLPSAKKFKSCFTVQQRPIATSSGNSRHCGSDSGLPLFSRRIEFVPKDREDHLHLCGCKLCTSFFVWVLHHKTGPGEKVQIDEFS